MSSTENRAFAPAFTSNDLSPASADVSSCGLEAFPQARSNSRLRRKAFVALAALSMIATAFLLTAADAAQRQTRYSAGGGVSSIDGRVLGYPRNCWSDTYLRE